MSRTFTDAMREKLLTMRVELESASQAGKESSETVQLDQSRVGRLSRMDAMQAQAMAQASGRRREEMLRNIAAALKRIDSGDYGYCRRCEEAIARKRLEFDPTSSMCIECATQAESK